MWQLKMETGGRFGKKRKTGCPLSHGGGVMKHKRKAGRTLRADQAGRDVGGGAKIRVEGRKAPVNEGGRQRGKERAHLGPGRKKSEKKEH